MKKLFAVLLAGIAALTVAGCGTDSADISNVLSDSPASLQTDSCLLYTSRCV